MNIKQEHIKLIVFVCVILLVITQPVMFWVLLKGHQYAAYKKMQRKIGENLVKPEYSMTLRSEKLKDALQWKNDHEFYKDGYICDVIELRQSGEFIIIKYVLDKKETRILSSIDSLLKGSEQHKQRPESGFNKLKLIWFINWGIYKLNVYEEYSFVFNSCNSFYSSVYIKPPLPPPRS